MKNAVRRVVALLLCVFAISAFGQELAIMNVNVGWNLKGNPFESAIKVADTFGTFDPAGKNIPGVTENVITVWKWNAFSQQWLFYSPRIGISYLASYAASHGFGVLTDIQPGEGFWVSASAKIIVPLPGYPGPVYTANYVVGNWSMGGLATGWNLLASPMSTTPDNISGMVNQMPPSPSDQNVSNSVVSLWTWDAVSGKWYFYSPSLASCGTDCLRNYIYQKGYLDFGSTGKNVEQGDGFWINIQSQPPVPTGGKG